MRTARILEIAFTSLLLLNPSCYTSACDDDKDNLPGHLHHRSQESASRPLSSPTRDLEWGDLNIIHTTDTHWRLGDFQSFVLRMKEKAKHKKVDLLVIDTGDYTMEMALVTLNLSPILKGLEEQLLEITNYTIYQLRKICTKISHRCQWKGSYLTSNANITTSSGESVPIGSRYRKFKTEQGRRITAFGIIFDFTGNANGTIVQPPAKLVKESWFKEAIQERPDVFLLAGHMGINDADWKVVFSTIRLLHPKVPIIILGGHFHIRDCRQLDDRSMSLASGRYMETVGWLSMKNVDKHSKLKFSRRYLDPNRLTYAFHAGRRFDTREGLNTTHGLAKAAVDFNITYQFGVAPQSFFGDRVSPTAQNSLSYLFTGPGGVLETVIKNPSRPHPPLVVVNTGAMRFDILAGNFTVNDQLITMPFSNTFVYVPDVPRAIAQEFLKAMNQGGTARHRSGSKNLRRDFERWDEVEKDESYHLGQDVQERYQRWVQLQSAHRRPDQPYLSSSSSSQVDKNVIIERSIQKHRLRTYGYVTQDQCPGIGDDVDHDPLPSFSKPDYVGTALPSSTDKVDVVFFDFITHFSLNALNTLGARLHPTRTYTMKDVQKYTDIESNQVLGIYAHQKWNHP
ncbi:hypothetical protein PSHT_07348 [Puccinia striiformis]|uniref:Putative 5'-nucleotidase C-terminal domain-containing protein n=1 Tax=Puccinia striiformis TaxID=27350 RepID=A0A2S4VYJ6_9BASI|nr:hypothetical protein PSHT_07348 [Puccinia striiformis]